MTPSMILRPVTLGTAVVALSLSACSGSQPAAPELPVTALVTVVPEGGATGVDPAAPVVVTFDHGVGWGMEQYADLHEGDVSGPVVEGTWTASEDRTTLTFTPAQALKLATRYTIHLGGGMMDEDDRPVDYEACGPGLGGHWATQGMMGGGMTGGGMMGGGGNGPGPGNGGHMGAGWEAADGTYGMVFAFTTAG